MTQAQWSQIVATAQTDLAFKQRLLAEPAKVFKDQGIDVPAGVEVRVVENTDRVVYFALPAAAPAGELSESELAGVTGGTGFANVVRALGLGGQQTTKSPAELAQESLPPSARA